MSPLANTSQNLNKEEINQYDRHLSLEGFGEKNQLKLKNSSVLVVGAGGLGCPVLQYLTAAGVGSIGIIDHDQVDSSNLQRQILFDHNDIGKPKSEVAATKLSRLNPFIHISPFVEKLTKYNAEKIFSNFDLIIDGTDNFGSRYLINDACVLFGKVLIHGSIHQFEGMVSVFNFQDGPTYRCLFPEQPDANSIPSCAEAGVLGVLPGIIGCWQATEAIKVLTGLGNPLSGKVLIYNALEQNIRTLELHALPKSKVISKLPETSYSCSSESLLKRKEKPIEEISEEYLKSLLDDGEDILLLDVREDWERIQYSIRPSLHQPLVSLISDSIVSPIDELNTQKKIVVYCKAGIRSRVACEALQSIGYKNLLNLSGGIDGWKQAFPEYNGNA